MFQRFRQLWRSGPARAETPGQPAPSILRLVAQDPDPAVTVRAQVQRTLHHRQAEREFMIIGLGRFGTSVAKTLVQQGHDVLAVDVDYQRVQALSTELPHVIQIDATNMDALQEIGADHFDTGIVCIGYDFESNLLATVLLRRLGVRRLIAKARTRIQREILQQVGADEVVLPEHEAGRRLAQRLSAIDFVDYLQLSPELSVIEMLAPLHIHNQLLADADIRRRYGLTVLAIRRGNELVCNPSGDTRVLPGDELLVVGNMADARRLSD